MKISQICSLVLLLMVGTAMAFGDSINDPKIVIHGANGNPVALFDRCPTQGCTNVGMNFSFGVPNSGSGTLFFTNTSGENWTSLLLIEKGEPAADIVCSSSLFSTCTTETLKNGAVAILLAGSKWCGQGIRNGQSFAVQFSCVDGSCWPGGLNFGAHANGSVPEPGTVAFMVTGLGAIVSRRKRWMRRLRA